MPQIKASNKDEITRFYTDNSKIILKKAREGIYCEIDNSYPEYIRQNIAYFKQHNFIDDYKLRSKKIIHLLNVRQKANKANRLFSKK